MICGSEQFDAAEALDIGLVDAVTEGDLLQAASDFLRQGRRGKRLGKLLTPPEESDEQIAAAAASALRRGKGRPNVAEAIRLVSAAHGTDPDATLADEREVFQRLRLGEDAFALRYLFFAERRAAVVEGLDPSAARRVETVGVVGGGEMGQGIARAFLASGIPVIVAERDEAALSRSLSAISDNLRLSSGSEPREPSFAIGPSATSGARCRPTGKVC